MEMVFANAYNGATRGTQPPLIHSRLKGLRRHIGSVAAVRTKDVPFPVRGAKDLAQKLAEGLDKYNLLAPIIDQVITLIPVQDIPTSEAGKVVFRTMAHVKATVRIIAEDGSFIDMVGSGHGGDRDDKAGGKASTYAWKDAILKGLTIPHEDMVDTDDEAATQGNSGRTQPPTPPKAAFVPSIVRTEAAPVDTGPPKGLADILAAIAAAKTEDDLKVVQKAMTDKVYVVTPHERLVASKDYVARRKAILEGK